VVTLEMLNCRVGETFGCSNMVVTALVAVDWPLQRAVIAACVCGGGGALFEEWVIRECVVDGGKIVTMNLRIGKLASW
jgi:hypothetical protein